MRTPGFRSACQLVLLGTALVLSAASASQSSNATEGDYYGQQVGTYDEYGRPLNALDQTYWCHQEASERFTASMCRRGPEACDLERQAAETEGLATSECVPVTPVACFQLGNDPTPPSTWCAASIEDCELWRRIDYDKNGLTGQPCQWQ